MPRRSGCGIHVVTRRVFSERKVIKKNNKHMKWISVEDGLPEPGVKVLAFVVDRQRPNWH